MDATCQHHLSSANKKKKPSTINLISQNFRFVSLADIQYYRRVHRCCVTFQTESSDGSRSPRVTQISGVHTRADGINVYELPQGEVMF